MYDFAILFGEITSDYTDFQWSGVLNLIHLEMTGGEVAYPPERKSN